MLLVQNNNGKITISNKNTTLLLQFMRLNTWPGSQLYNSLLYETGNQNIDLLSSFNAVLKYALSGF